MIKVYRVDRGEGVGGREGKQETVYRNNQYYNMVSIPANICVGQTISLLATEDSARARSWKVRRVFWSGESE